MLKERKPAPWTAEEDAFLRAHYVTRGGTYVAAHLGRTRQAVNAYAARIGLRQEKRPPLVWTPERDAMVIALYPTKGSAYLAELLGKTEVAVRRRAGQLGVKRIREEKAPSEAERKSARLSAKERSRRSRVAAIKRENKALFSNFRKATPAERRMIIAFVESRAAARGASVQAAAPK